MDADTYKQLMLCLKDVKVTPIPKDDKSTAKKVCNYYFIYFYLLSLSLSLCREPLCY